MLETILQSGSVNRDIFVSVAGMLIGTAVLAVTKPSLPRSLWARIKARYFSMRKGDALGVLVCDLRGDDNRSISYLILSHLRQNYVRPVGADGGEGRPLIAAKFPLSLQGTGDTDQDERRIEQRAMKWLAKANADIIIWGDHAKSGNINTINILGLRSKEKIHAKIHVDFNDGALNNLIAEVVTREVASISTDAFAHPSKYDLDSLRSILRNTRQLVESSFPGFNAVTELRIRESISNVLSELCRRSSNVADWRAATENSHKIVVNLEAEKFSPRWAASVNNLLRYQTVAAWSGECLETLDYTLQAAADLETYGSEFYSGATPSLACRVSILKCISKINTPDDKVAIHPLIVAKDLRASNFFINTDYNKKLNQVLFPTSRVSLSAFVGFVDDLVIEDSIKCFLVHGYLESIFSFEADAHNHHDIVRYLASLIKEEVPLLTEKSAWKNYLSLFVLTRIASNDGFSPILDSDRSTPIEFLMRAASTKLYHFSSKFPEKSPTRVAFLDLTAHTLAKCALYSKDDHVFKLSEDFWGETHRLAIVHHPKSLVRLKISRCIDLNNWGVRKPDLQALDKSIAIIKLFALDKSLPANDRVHSGYVMAFAWAGKAAVGRHTDFAKAKRDAEEALDICQRCESVVLPGDELSTRKSISSVRKLRIYIDELELA